MGNKSIFAAIIVVALAVSYWAGAANPRVSYVIHQQQMQQGAENLAAFYAKLVSLRSGSSDPLRIHVVGDSKAGWGGSGYQLSALLRDAGADAGYPIETTHESFGGQNSYALKRVAPVIAALNPAPDLVILWFWTNEGVGHAFGGKQTTAEMQSNVKTAIATLRAAHGPNEQSIMILGPTSGNYSPYGTTVEQMAERSAALAEAARDVNVAYFELLERFRRPHDEAGWMDNLGEDYDFAHVHPEAPHMFAVAGLLSQSLFPMRNIALAD